MNTRGIKFLAVLAVLAMAFAAFAVAVPSEEVTADDAGMTWDQAKANPEYIDATVTGTYKLVKDVTITGIIALTDAAAIIDLNGFTLTAKNTEGKGITATGSLEIKNTSTDKIGTANITAVNAAIDSTGALLFTGNATKNVVVTMTVSKLNEAYGIKAASTIGYSYATVTVYSGATSEGVDVIDSVGINAVGKITVNNSTVKVYAYKGVVGNDIDLGAKANLTVKALFKGVEIGGKLAVVSGANSASNEAKLNSTLFSGYAGEDEPLGLDLGTDGSLDIDDYYFTIEVQGYYLVAWFGENLTCGIPTVSSNGTFKSVGTSGYAEVKGTVIEYNNYTGSQVFSGAISDIIVTGDNIITTEDKPVIIRSVSELTMKSIDGLGTLSLYGKDVGYGIVTHDTFNIKAIKQLNIELTGDGASVGIEAFGNNKIVDIYETELNIEATTDTNTAGSFGIQWQGTLKIRSSVVDIEAGYGALYANGDSTILDIEASTVSLEGSESAIKAGNVDILSASLVGASVTDSSEDNYWGAYGVFVKGALNVQSEAILTTDGIYLENGENSGVNNSTINNTGEMVVVGTYENQGLINNTGVIGVYGALKQTVGVLNNMESGSIQAYAYGSITNPTDVTKKGTITSTTTTVFSPRDLTILDSYPLADGTFGVSAYIAFINSAGNSVATTFYGKVTVDASGNIISGDFTRSFVQNNVTYDATVSMSVQTSTTGAIEAMDLDSSGRVWSQIDSTGDYKINVVDSSSSMAYDGQDGRLSEPAKAIASGSTGLQVTGGKLVNDGTIVMNVVNTILNKGTIENNGKMAFTNTVTMTEGTFTNNGALSVYSLTVGSKATLKGNDVAVDCSAQRVITLNGTIDTAFIFSGEYTYDDAGTKVKVEFENSIDVYGKTSGFTITMPVASDKNKGFVTLNGMSAAADKTADITIVKGGAIAQNVIGTDVVLKALSGSTLQIAKVGVIATQGVIAVQDGATLLKYIKGDPVAKAYGEITYDITFTTDGYTYFGNVGFALENADGKEPLYLKDKQDTFIETTTAVKPGIVLIFGEGSTLTIQKAASATEYPIFTMGEGAKIVLAKGASVTIKEDVTASGVFEYDENIVSLSKIVPDAGDVVISAVTETSKEPSKVSIVGQYDNGYATIEEGVSTGAIALDFEMDTTVTPNILKNTGNFYIADDAVSENVLTFVGNNRYATVGIAGELDVAASATFPVYGNIIGTGGIVLGDGAKITMYTNASFTGIIANAGETDSLALLGVSFIEPVNGKIVYVDEPTLQMTVTSVAKVGTVPAYMKAEGSYKLGAITVYGSTTIDGFVIDSEASMIVPEDSTLTIGKTTVVPGKTYNAESKGLLEVAGTLNMRVAEDSSTVNYGVLEYQIKFIDAPYVVYASLAAGVEYASEGDVFIVDKKLDINTKMVIPEGVTIIIEGEDAYINLLDGGYIVLGSGSTYLGSEAAIVGNVVLTGDYTFVVVFPDADASQLAVYENTGMTEEAVYSDYLINNTLYATVYAKEGKLNMNYTATPADVHSIAAKALRTAVMPYVEGYTVGAWILNKYDPAGATNFIGDGYYTATATPLKYSVFFTAVDGIQYFYDNTYVNAPNVTLELPYGTEITAKAQPGYTGTATVNGAIVYVITEDTIVIGAGVQPVPQPEPEPTPTPEEKSEWTITTILLVILVILIAIMAVIVALRLNRS